MDHSAPPPRATQLPAARHPWWRLALLAAALVVGPLTATARAQRPDTTRADTTKKKVPRAVSTKADSARLADSLLIIREAERIRGEPRIPAEPPQRGAQGGAQGPTNPRLLPDISAVGDLIGDLSPSGTTQPDSARFSVREIEVAIQAAVDPFFRGDVFFGFSDLEGVSIEQAYLTATSLPLQFEVRLGRYLMPVGKQNTSHRHDLHTIEYPWVIQRFFAPEGLKGTGVWVSRVFAPFGFYQELLLTAVDRFGERPEGITVAEPVNRHLSGLGYSARLRNYIDLSQSANIELSASAITGEREEPLVTIPPPFDGRAGMVRSAPSMRTAPIASGGAAPLDQAGIASRQSVVGIDVTYRWRPLQQGLYKSFILQGELMRQINQNQPSTLIQNGVQYAFAGPTRDATGGYLFARYQLTRRTYVVGRFDAVQDPLLGNETLRAGSGYVEMFPSEFSKLMVGYEYVAAPAGATYAVGKNRIILQAAFALGPHRPHPF